MSSWISFISTTIVGACAGVMLVAVSSHVGRMVDDHTHRRAQKILSEIDQKAAKHASDVLAAHNKISIADNQVTNVSERD